MVLVEWCEELNNGMVVQSVSAERQSAHTSESGETVDDERTSATNEEAKRETK